MTTAAEQGSWLGRAAAELRLRLDVPQLLVFESVPSTMDVAHALAADGGEDGTIVLAEMQDVGRGRHGRRWASGRGEGIWLSMILRRASAEGVGALSLRVALELAAALEPMAGAAVELKWPNDLFVRGRKLAGVLSEARWRGAGIDWIVIGVGVNLREPAGFSAAALDENADPAAALAAVVRALRRAAARSGELTDGEMVEWGARDRARGRRCVAPEAGTVAGITRAGELIVEAAGEQRLHRGGSLVLEEDP